MDFKLCTFIDMVRDATTYDTDKYMATSLFRKITREE